MAQTPPPLLPLPCTAWDIIEALTSEARERAEPFLCSVCFGLPCRPCHPDGCGHIFCERCLGESLRRRSECPVCRAFSSRRVPANAVAELLLASWARCPRCPAQLPLASLVAHLDVHQRAEALPWLQARCEQLEAALEEVRATKAAAAAD